MTYRRALVGRWSRRDRLAVVAVAATVALLTGVVVLGASVAGSGTALADEYDVAATAAWHDSLPAARAAADDALVVPVARPTTGDGSEVVVAGVPSGTAWSDLGVAFPEAPRAGATLGTAAETRTVRLRGSAGTTTVTAGPRGRSALPPSWYVASPSTVREIGADGALVLSPADGAVPTTGAAVPGVLGFLVAGSRQVLVGLGVAAAVAAVLVAVTVHGTTRATVVDRRATLGVLAATGARPRHVVALFAARAAALTATGVALGYGGGVVAVHAAENVAAAAGVATALAVRVGPRAAGLLVVAYGVVCVLGAAAGAVAAAPARRPPARLFGDPPTRSGPLPGVLRPKLLDYRAAVPTAAGVAALAAVGLVVVAGASVAGPAVAGTGAVVAEPGAAHPLGSTVPAGYAAVLRDRGTPASGEILVLAAVDSRPVLVRGARFGAFANVSGARLRTGRPPRTPSEAVVGADLAHRLEVEVGDSLAVGGTARPVVTRVRVVGTYAAPGAGDDQLVVPLATARHLSGKPPGTVQFVRTGDAPARPAADSARADDGPVVVGVSGPRQVVAGGTVAAEVTLVNAAATERNRTVEVTLGDASASRSVAVGGGDRRTVTVTLPAEDPGRHELRAGTARAPVTVVSADAVRVRGLPDSAPVDSAPLVAVVDARGRPVSDAAVSVGDRTRRTGPDGQVRVPLPEPGTATVAVRDGDHTATATVRVSAAARRTLGASVRVEPARPTPLTRPVAVVRLTNPWNRTLDRAVTVVGPASHANRSVRLAGGESRTVRVPLARRPPGEYRVAVHARGRELATGTVTIAGDDRLVAAASTHARRGGVVGVGLGTAVAAAVGDLRLLAAVVLALAALAALGATLSTFAAAVRARRATLGVRRAAGATRRQLLRTVLGDALRIGVPAAVVGVAAGAATVRALESTGVLVAYGVALRPRPGLSVLVGLVAAGTAIAVLGAVGAAAALFALPPGELLNGPAVAPPGGDDRD